MKKLSVLFVFLLFLAFSGKSFSQGYEFDLNDLEGNSVKLSDLLKKGPVLVQFWATWCVPCKEEMKGPVPYRGTDDERNRQVNERPGSDTARFSPVQARMRDENADAADKQADNGADDNPVGHTNKYGVRRRSPFVRHVDHSEVPTDSTASDRAG